MKLAVALLFAACAAPDVAPPIAPVLASGPPLDAPEVSQLIFDAPAVETPAPVDVAAVNLGPEVWLKGSTHVHAKPSGDSSEPIDDVIKWY